MVQVILHAVFWVFGGASVLFILYLLYCINYGNASRKWTSIEGEIVKLNLRVMCEGSSAQAYIPVLKYSYKVGNKCFSGTRLSYQLNVFGNIKSANERLTKLQSMHPVLVYYDPNQPTRSVLETGYSVDSYFYISMLIGYLVFLQYTFPLNNFA